MILLRWKLLSDGDHVVSTEEQCRQLHTASLPMLAAQPLSASAQLGKRTVDAVAPALIDVFSLWLEW